jgi:hypothetical protein
MFIRFKQFLFKSRVLTYANEEFDRVLKQSQNMNPKEVTILTSINNIGTFD